MLRAIIFDVDGTLAETEELHRRAFNEAFAAAGLSWEWSRGDYARLLAVTGGKERIAHHVASAGLTPLTSEVIAELHRDKTERYVHLMASGAVGLRPGIAALVSAAREAGLLLGIATTTSRPNVDALIAATFGAPADAVFDVIAAGDEVAAKKPAPDVYLLALERLGVAASEAVALEDSRNGVMSARAAGAACVVSPSIYTASDVFPDDVTLIASFEEISGIGALAGFAGQGTL